MFKGNPMRLFIAAKSISTALRAMDPCFKTMSSNNMSAACFAVADGNARANTNFDNRSVITRTY